MRSILRVTATTFGLLVALAIVQGASAHGALSDITNATNNLVNSTTGGAGNVAGGTGTTTANNTKTSTTAGSSSTPAVATPSATTSVTSIVDIAVSTVTKSTTNLVQDTTDAVAPTAVASPVTNAVSRTTQTVDSTVDNVTQSPATQDVTAPVDQTVNTVANTVAPVTNTVTQTTQPLLDTVTQTVQPVVNSVTQTVQQTANAVDNVVTQTVPQTLDNLAAALPVTQPVVDTVEQVLPSQPVMAPIVKDTTDTVDSVVNNVVEPVTEPVLGNAVGDVVDPVLDPVAQGSDPGGDVPPAQQPVSPTPPVIVIPNSLYPSLTVTGSVGGTSNDAGSQTSVNGSSASVTLPGPGQPTEPQSPIGGASIGTAQLVDLIDAPSGPVERSDVTIPLTSESGTTTAVRSGAQDAGPRFTSIDITAAAAHAESISAGPSGGTPGAPTRLPFDPLPGLPATGLSSGASTSLSLGGAGGAHTLAVALWLVLGLMLIAGRSYFKRAFQFPTGITQNLTAPPG